jgi:hypothetical protein
MQRCEVKSETNQNQYTTNLIKNTAESHRLSLTQVLRDLRRTIHLHATLIPRTNRRQHNAVEKGIYWTTCKIVTTLKHKCSTQQMTCPVRCVP